MKTLYLPVLVAIVVVGLVVSFEVRAQTFACLKIPSDMGMLSGANLRERQSELVRMCSELIRAPSFDVEKAKALDRRAHLYRDMGELEKGIADFTTIITLRNIPDSRRANAYVDRGRLYEKLGKVDLAIADYKVGGADYLIKQLEQDRKRGAAQAANASACLGQWIDSHVIGRVYKLFPVRLVSEFGSQKKCSVRGHLSQCVFDAASKIKRYSDFFPVDENFVVAFNVRIEAYKSIAIEYVLDGVKVQSMKIHFAIPGLMSGKVGDVLDSLNTLCDLASIPSDDDFAKAFKNYISSTPRGIGKN